MLWTTSFTFTAVNIWLVRHNKPLIRDVVPSYASGGGTFATGSVGSVVAAACGIHGRDNVVTVQVGVTHVVAIY